MIELSSLVREDLKRLPAYVPGKRSGDNSTAVVARLSSNESPFDPLPTVQSALHAEVAGSNRYPDMSCESLVQALSRHLSMESNCIAVGNGSSSLIRDLVATVAGPGDEVLFATPSFGYYGNAAIIAGATPIPVDLNLEFEHDLDAMVRAVSERTKVVFICNPNNPTGTTVPVDAILAFVENLNSSVLVVIDEAYIEFSEGAGSAIELVGLYPNVAVLRTFSKAYGLAGLRVGFLVGPSELVECLRRVTVPFSVNPYAQAAAVASLSAAAQVGLGARVRELSAAREEFTSRLQALGMRTVASHSNFVFLPLGQDSRSFVQFCEARGVMVRLTGGGVRVTVGSATENQHFVEAADAWRETYENNAQ